ncbi:MAG: hypothetical protein Q9209_001426 [Squamulea sp. 1 TL-2023]
MTIDRDDPIHPLNTNAPPNHNENRNSPSLAAIEAGEIQIQDHFSHFSSHLAAAVRPSISGPRLPIPAFVDLYKRNCHPHGRHFVVHQHDHPIAGVHYDLRLQISETSSVSFAVVYGLPGDPGSRRLVRMAVETRVHCFWISKRKIRIRLHGTRLPPSYTLSIRLLTANNHHEQPKKPVRKRRRKQIESPTPQKRETPEASEVEEVIPVDVDVSPTASNANITAYNSEIEEQEDEEIRLTNAYPGATNSINSIHQRKWLLSMDRHASGFRPHVGEDGTRTWVRGEQNGRLLGFEPFFVEGRDHERSVVTGRTADEVMMDEGAEGFTGRKGWKAILK